MYSHILPYCTFSGSVYSLYTQLLAVFGTIVTDIVLTCTTVIKVALHAGKTVRCIQCRGIVYLQSCCLGPIIKGRMGSIANNNNFIVFNTIMNRYMHVLY